MDKNVDFVLDNIIIETKTAEQQKKETDNMVERLKAYAETVKNKDE